jgi:uncharacterized alkaline shock family protein YloU
MSESEQQHNESPLLSERGSTMISDTVVSSIAGRAAQEVEGVHMGGGASRTAGGVLGSITGSESQTRGVSVEVGRTETAIDLKMGIEYNKNILQTVEEVRRRITERVETITGLRITELNATITDITFPEKEQRRRLGSRSRTRELGDGSTGETGTEPETRTMPRSELRPGASERETTEVEPRSRTYTEGTSGPVPEEEVRVEGRPLEEEATAELRPGDTETVEQPTDEAPATPEETETRPETETHPETETRPETETPEEQETRAEAETSEETEAEVRRRRRAEERARRRRRTEDS